MTRAASLSSDLTKAGFELWRQVVDQFGVQHQLASRRIATAHRESAGSGAGANGGASSADWQSLYQEQLQRGIELSSGAWEAFYETQENLLQVCDQLAASQSRLLQESLELVSGGVGESRDRAAETGVSSNDVGNVPLAATEEEPKGKNGKKVLY
jgi:hypothetical protein